MVCLAKQLNVKVDLPDPDGPTRAITLPDSNLNLHYLKLLQLNCYSRIVCLIFLFQLKIYSYFNALIGSILVTAKDGNKDASTVITIEKIDIDKMDSMLISLGISLRK